MAEITPEEIAATRRIIAQRDAAQAEQRERDRKIDAEIEANRQARKKYGPPWKDPRYADKEWHPDYVPPWPEELPEVEREPEAQVEVEAPARPALADMEASAVKAFEHAMGAVKGGCGAQVECPECEHVFDCPNDVPDHPSRRAAGKELLAYLNKRAETGGSAGGGDTFTWDDEAVNSSIVGRWVQDDYAKTRAELVARGVLAEHEDEEPAEEDFDPDDPLGDE